MVEQGVQTKIPALFRQLTESGYVTQAALRKTEDGLYALATSLAELLARGGITTVPGDRGRQLKCALFFDDWYLYAVTDETAVTYSLFKMREQEKDLELGLDADGDTPGVTVSFIAMDTECLMRCLQDPCAENRKALSDEINRVAAQRKQTHSKALKAYFCRTRAQGPYLIAALYTETMAAMARQGVLAVPDRYALDYGKTGLKGRLPRFIEENNRAANMTVCDHRQIYIRRPEAPTEQERLAILATHTGNVSFSSFAAEVQFHALFLTWWAKIPIPVVGSSPYASAIRADMSIADAEMTGPTPYYRLNSRLVKNQERCHKGGGQDR